MFGSRRLQSGFIAFGLLALASLSNAQDLESKVSFECKAEPLSVLLKDLSQKSGVSLECGPGFDNFPVIVSVKDRSLQSVMDRIASLSVGKWVKTDKGHRLENDKEAWKKLQQAEFAKRREEFAKALTEYTTKHSDDGLWSESKVKGLIEKEVRSRESMIENLRKNNPEFDTSQVQIHKGSTREASPATPALFKILSKLAPETLAMVAPGQRIVFSTSPTSAQLKFPFDAAPILNSFVDSHNLLVSLAKGAPRPPDNVHFSGGVELESKPVVGQLAKMLVILTRRSSESGVGIEVKFVDQDGQFIGTSARSLTINSVEEEVSGIKVENKDPLVFSDLSKEVSNALVSTNAAGDGSQNVMMFSSKSGGGGALRISSNGPAPSVPLSTGAMAFLSDPVANDPQSLYASEGLIGSAKAAHRDLVALLPDSCLVRLARTSLKSVSAGEFLQSVDAGGCDIDDSEGWLLIKPTDRGRVAMTQMDRVGAKRLYSAVISRGHARLRERAMFAQSLGTFPSGMNFGLTTLKVIDPYVADSISTDIDIQPTVLQFMGTLPESFFEQRQPVNSFSVASMTPQQKGYWERLVYGADRMSGIIGEGDFVGISMSRGNEPTPPESKPEGVRTEPTESMPNGLPVAGVVRIAFESNDLVKAMRKGSRGGQFLSAEGLGGYLSLSSSVTAPEFSGKLTVFDSFVQAKGADVTVTPVFDSWSNNFNFGDWWLQQGALPVAYEALPAEFRDQVAKAKDKMGNARISFGGGQKPPQ